MIDSLVLSFSNDWTGEGVHISLRCIKKNEVWCKHIFMKFKTGTLFPYHLLTYLDKIALNVKREEIENDKNTLTFWDLKKEVQFSLLKRNISQFFCTQKCIFVSQKEKCQNFFDSSWGNWKHGQILKWNLYNTIFLRISI